jgi:hypothetical protein
MRPPGSPKLSVSRPPALPLSPLPTPHRGEATRTCNTGTGPSTTCAGKIYQQQFPAQSSITTAGITLLVPLCGSSAHPLIRGKSCSPGRQHPTQLQRTGRMAESPGRPGTRVQQHRCTHLPDDSLGSRKINPSALRFTWCRLAPTRISKGFFSKTARTTRQWIRKP